MHLISLWYNNYVRSNRWKKKVTEVLQNSKNNNKKCYFHCITINRIRQTNYNFLLYDIILLSKKKIKIFIDLFLNKTKKFELVRRLCYQRRVTNCQGPQPIITVTIIKRN